MKIRDLIPRFMRGGACGLAIVFLAAGAVQAAIPASERQALLDLYTSTNGAGWATRTGWNGPAGTECTWFGVTCNAAQTTVTALGLQFNDLSGPLPASIGDLPGLAILSLYSNQLSGSIPSLAAHTALQNLRLEGNGLSGPMPSFGSNPALQIVSLHSNQLSGSIPSFASNPALRTLTLGSNQLSGSIPSFAANPALEILAITFNQLSGPIPSFATNTSLQVVSLESNQLSGPIPSFAANTALTELLLSSNQLSGPIPSFAANAALEYLYLDHNQLSGPVPSFAGAAALQYLRLGHNRLSGALPSFASNTGLRSLRLNSNQLTGSVHPSLGTLTNLLDQALDLRWNALFSTDPALIAFLNSKQFGGNWQGTQTIPVTGLGVSGILHTQITVNWIPITYTGDPGHYQVFYSTVSGGPYTPFATVTASKSASSLGVTGLTPLTPYFFVVETTTAPHANNQNTVVSGSSAEVASVTTPVELMRFELE